MLTMLTVAKRMVSEYQELAVDETARPKWQHLKKLHEIQQKDGLRLANRLSEWDVKYNSQKMTVNLATQLSDFIETAPSIRVLSSPQGGGCTPPANIGHPLGLKVTTPLLMEGSVYILFVWVFQSHNDG